MVQSQHLVKRIGCRMERRATGALVAIPGGASAARRSRTQGASAEHHGQRLLGVARGQAQYDAQIMGHRTPGHTITNHVRSPLNTAHILFSR